MLCIQVLKNLSYIGHNNKRNMKYKNCLEEAKNFTVFMAVKLDNVYPRMRRKMERDFCLANGFFMRVTNNSLGENEVFSLAQQHYAEVRIKKYYERQIIKYEKHDPQIVIQIRKELSEFWEIVRRYKCRNF